MGSAVFQFVLCAAIIIVAGTVLTKCADAIAEITKLGRLLVGSIFLAGATSLPELTVDISAVRKGMPDLAVGDLMGSGLFNLLILAILDLTRSSRGRMLSRSAAAHALSGTMSVALITLAAIDIFLAERAGTIGVLNVGIGVWLILIAYVLGLRVVYYDQLLAIEESPKTEVLMPAKHMSLSRAIAGYVGAAAVIVVTAPFLADAAGEIADHTGLGKTFVGTTLVALSTSLPELVASLTALRMGAYDLAIGNVFGSNSFNMVLLVPLDMIHSGPILAAVSPTHALTAMATVLVTAVALLGQLYKVERRLKFIEPDALAVIVLVIAALALVYYLR
jgi:cation:H+ antiporter